MDRSEEWLDWVTTEMFGLMHNVETDNFDSRRYVGEDPLGFAYQRHASYFSFLRKNAQMFMAARELLVDLESKDLFDAHQAQPYEKEFMSVHVARVTGVDAHVLTITDRTSAVG